MVDMAVGRGVFSYPAAADKSHLSADMIILGDVSISNGAVLVRCFRQTTRATRGLRVKMVQWRCQDAGHLTEGAGSLGVPVGGHSGRAAAHRWDCCPGKRKKYRSGPILSGDSVQLEKQNAAAAGGWFIAQVWSGEA